MSNNEHQLLKTGGVESNKTEILWQPLMYDGTSLHNGYWVSSCPTQGCLEVVVTHRRNNTVSKIWTRQITVAAKFHYNRHVRHPLLLRSIWDSTGLWWSTSEWMTSWRLMCIRDCGFSRRLIYLQHTYLFIYSLCKHKTWLNTVLGFFIPLISICFVFFARVTLLGNQPNEYY